MAGCRNRWTIPLLVLMLTSALGTAGCSEGGKQQQVDGMTMEVVTDPAPLQVGETAMVIATLTHGGEPVNDCKVRFRQHMPGHEMSGDDTFFTMAPRGPEGAYVAESGEFTMGGDWELEFVMECPDATHTVAFPYYLEWPE